MKEKKAKEALENWKLDSATMHKVRIQCAVDKLSQSELAELAIAAYLESKRAPAHAGAKSAAHTKYAEEHTQLDEVLDSNFPELKEALRMNLKGWAIVSRLYRDRPPSRHLDGGGGEQTKPKLTQSRGN